MRGAPQSWEPDRSALELLEQRGPFEGQAFRTAYCEATAGSRDVSLGVRRADGSLVAIALIARRGAVLSVPYGYGGVAATQPLDEDELTAVLAQARRLARAHRIVVRSLPLDDDVNGGRQFATTTIVRLDPDGEFEAGLSKHVRSKIRRVLRAGATVRSTEDPTAFLDLYRRAAAAWGVEYPSPVIRALAAHGVLRFYEVELAGATVGATAALIGTSHWLYWLGAQSEEGRRKEAGYLSVAELLRDARAHGVLTVNLGGSAGLAGVATFKQRFGGVDAPLFERGEASLASRVAIQAAGRAAGRAVQAIRGARR